MKTGIFQGNKQSMPQVFLNMTFIIKTSAFVDPHSVQHLHKLNFVDNWNSTIFRKEAFST